MRETIEVIVPVQIEYRTPEGRKEAVKCACDGLFIDLWSSRAGSISVKRAKRKKGRLA